MPTAYTSKSGIHWTEQSPAAALDAVILIHGLGGDSGFWEAEQKALGERFRVLAIDLRGSGQSAGSTGPFSIEDLANDVISVLDHAGISSAHVIGFSMGGLVAQALAVAAPHRVKSLVLAATFATTNQQASLFLKAVGSVYRAGATAKQLYELVLPWLFSEKFLSDPRAAPYKVYPEDQSAEQSREDWLRLLDAQLAFDGRAELSKIRMPTLVVCGDEDRLAPRSDAGQLIKGIKGSVLKMIPGGHLINIESHDEFMAHIEDFLSAVSCEKTPK
ncbi:alpha/beta fold hydrolase [Dyella flava]|uniref:Alpha/beta fold hydrolase n=1 Tax=Dyella flava TaxID=1920170 RepID=A0ABS2JZY6_9GAMM|nr:alpha/beta hydrolase [Dyella flava]MBM7124204.1 alpha/beta fold hydrolase [Dyella flava]GLQ50518.1 alpha/beta hydrolase fold protein [Dyella flava]